MPLAEVKPCLPVRLTVPLCSFICPYAGTAGLHEAILTRKTWSRALPDKESNWSKNRWLCFLNHDSDVRQIRTAASRKSEAFSWQYVNDGCRFKRLRFDIRDGEIKGQRKEENNDFHEDNLSRDSIN